MRILFIGDIVGRPGRNAVARRLPALRARHAPELVVANAENSAAGLGATPAILAELREMGVHAFTLGNHAWRKSEMIDAIDRIGDVVRPVNFPDGSPGRGAMLATLPDGRTAGIINAAGRVYMEPAQCPFVKAEAALAEFAGRTNVILIDFHAEATSEKAALAWHLDGRCSAVIGTHTHVQTADEWILPGGTAFISDAGMCGPYHSIIGVDTRRVVEKFVYGMPRKFEVAASGPSLFSGVFLEVDDATGRTLRIERILERDPAR